MTHKGHYGEYSGNAKHSRKTNSWEEEDVKRGIREEKSGHKGHAEALFDDAHDSYNWKPGMDTHAESPLNNTGVTGLNYSKELEYMPIEDDMDRGMSRESSSPLNDKGHGGAVEHNHNTFSLSELENKSAKELARSKKQATKLYNPEGQGGFNYESEDEQTYAGGEVGADYDEEGSRGPKKMTHFTNEKPMPRPAEFGGLPAKKKSRRTKGIQGA